MSDAPKSRGVEAQDRTTTYARISPRGFANETFVISYGPEWREEAEYTLDCYDNDVDARTERDVRGPFGHGKVIPFLGAVFGLCFPLEYLHPSFDAREVLGL